MTTSPKPSDADVLQLLSSVIKEPSPEDQARIFVDGLVYDGTVCGTVDGRIIMKEEDDD